MPRKKKQPKGWQYSSAKGILYRDIVEGRVPNDMAWEEAYAMHPEEYDKVRTAKSSGKDLFEGRLDALRIEIATYRSRADEDLRAFENYKNNHRPAAQSAHGYPQWRGSEADKLLKKHIDGLQEDELRKQGLPLVDDKGNLAYVKVAVKNPKELWEGESKAEYQKFPLNVFRDHIKQEIRTRQYYHQLKAVGKKKPYQWVDDKEKLEKGDDGYEQVLLDFYFQNMNL